MNIKISKIQPQDALGVRIVLRDTWLATYPNKELNITVEDIAYSYQDLFTEESIKQFQDRIKNFLDSIQTFVAKDGEKIVGVCRVIIETDKNELKMLYILGRRFEEEKNKMRNGANIPEMEMVLKY